MTIDYMYVCMFMLETELKHFGKEETNPSIYVHI